MKPILFIRFSVIVLIALIINVAFMNLPEKLLT
jgi:hypothetical protein